MRSDRCGGDNRPTIDRAEELCTALGITMMIGGNPEREPEPPDDP